MKKMDPVPITNWEYTGFAQVPCTLIFLDVVPSKKPNEYDVYICFRGYAALYLFTICISINHYSRCKAVSIGGYNSQALKLARNEKLEITTHPNNPYRVMLNFKNAQGFRVSTMIPKISVMPFFYERPTIAKP